MLATETTRKHAYNGTHDSLLKSDSIGIKTNTRHSFRVAVPKCQKATSFIYTVCNLHAIHIISIQNAPLSGYVLNF